MRARSVSMVQDFFLGALSCMAWTMLEACHPDRNRCCSSHWIFRQTSVRSGGIEERTVAGNKVCGSTTESLDEVPTAIGAPARMKDI